MYETTKINNDTKPSYRIDNLPQRYNGALLKQTELTLKENKDVMKNLYLKTNKSNSF